MRLVGFSSPRYGVQNASSEGLTKLEGLIEEMLAVRNTGRSPAAHPGTSRRIAATDSEKSEKQSGLKKTKWRRPDTSRLKPRLHETSMILRTQRTSLRPRHYDRYPIS